MVIRLVTVWCQAGNEDKRTSIEKGRYTPSLPLALALARYFETKVEEMFNDEGA